MKKNLLIILLLVLGFCPLFSQSYDVEWTNDTGVTIAGNTLIKTASTGWNAGASSTNVLGSNTDGWVEISITSKSSFAFGLSLLDLNLSLSSIEFGLFLTSGGDIRVYESGSYKGKKGVYTVGDKLKIERLGSTITYKKNDVVVYTSTKSSSTQLIVDASLYYTNARISDTKASFSSPDSGDGGDGSGSSVWVDDENSDIRYSDGKVVIGPDDILKPADYRLYVSGGIMTEKAKVALKNTNSWADFVFEESYQLNSIAEVKDFIKNNKHLPHVPSAKKVVEDGINIAEMDAILLRQIEELWLHVIKLSEENKALKIQFEIKE